MSVMEFVVKIWMLVVIFNSTRESVVNGQLLFREDADELFENSECKTQDNLWGVCTRASLCPHIKLNISETKICSFHGNEAIICCVRSSQLACFEYRVDHGELFEKQKQHFFVGGEKAKPREHPHMAAIGWTKESIVSWKCGGSLISKNFLITAAHCASDRGVPPDSVRAGVVNLVNTDPTSPQPVDYNVTEIIIHPDYKAPVIYHDIALLRIIPAKYSVNLFPICLWPSKEIPTTELTAMGFGTTSFAGPQSNELFVGTLQHIPQDQCIAAYKTNRDRRFSNGIVDSQMCANDPAGSKDTCQGDSGGPLQFVNHPFFKVYIVGITSFGEGCAGPTPGVYTKVQAYLAWIENIVWPEFSK